MRSVFFERPREQSRFHSGVKRFLFIWAPVICGVCVIAAESTAIFSAANTGHWLRPIAQTLFGPIEKERWEQIHHLLRKSGHFLGYGTLCVLFLRAWLFTFAPRVVFDMRTWRLWSWSLAVFSTFLVASCDELHQSFLPSRTGLFSDVVLDTCGGFVLSGLMLGLTWRPGVLTPR